MSMRRSFEPAGQEPFKEDYYAICAQLTPALWETRSGRRVERLEYDEDHGIIVAVINGGRDRRIAEVTGNGITTMINVLKSLTR